MSILPTRLSHRFEIIFALFVLLEVGCVSPKKTNEQRNFFAASDSAPIVTPQCVTLSWDYPATEMDGVSFNVYETDDLSRPLAFFTNVSSLSLSIPIQSGAHFYGVKATRNGIESDWAR
jgi:hypothetical protein